MNFQAASMPRRGARGESENTVLATISPSLYNQRIPIIHIGGYQCIEDESGGI